MNYLRTLLDDAASAPAPPARVDVELAVRSGTRIVRRRRTAWAVGAASAVVACLVASALVFTPAAQKEPAVPLPAPGFSKVFEPEKKYATFGWLPGEIDQSIVETRPEWHRQWVTNGSWQVELRMVTAGRDMELSGTDRDFAVDAAQVDHRWLYRTDPPDGRDVEWNAVRITARDFALRWQYAPGAWIEVAVQNADNPKDLLLDVVNGVRIGEEDVRVPFHLTSPPGRPTGLYIEELGFRWSASLQYQGDASVTVESVGATPDSMFDIEVDGKKARLENNHLVVAEPSGVHSQVHLPDGDPVELYRRLRIDR